MINSKLLSFVFYSFISCMRFDPKNWTTTQFLHDAFEKLSSEKKKSLDTIVTDALIWNQEVA